MLVAHALGDCADVVRRLHRDGLRCHDLADLSVLVLCHVRSPLGFLTFASDARRRTLVIERRDEEHRSFQGENRPEPGQRFEKGARDRCIGESESSMG
jgi:hypothetical protein